MASVLARKNFEVTILEWDRSSKLPANERINNINVNRMKLKAPYGRNLSFFLPIWWIYSSFFILKNNFKIIQARNLDNILIVWLLFPIKRMKVIYSIADFYSESYIDVENEFLRKIFAKIERLLIVFIKNVIIPDEGRLRQINVKNANYTIIYNSPPDRYTKLKNKLTNKPHTNFVFTVFYAGILEKDRGLDLICKALCHLRGIKVIIAGFGRLENKFLRISQDNPRIEFKGRVSYEKVLEQTFLSDCVVALYDPKLPNNIYASPNKLFEAMMCGKPIIVNDGTLLSTRVKNEKCGLIVKYGDLADLQNKIMLLKNDENFAQSLGKNGRIAYVGKFGLPLMERRLLKLYNSFDSEKI